MTISYISGEDRSMTIEVNGNKVCDVALNSGSWESPGTHPVDITLNPGKNVIRFYTSNGWMPDIDCITLGR